MLRPHRRDVIDIDRLLRRPEPPLLPVSDLMSLDIERRPKKMVAGGQPAGSIDHLALIRLGVKTLHRAVSSPPSAFSRRQKFVPVVYAGKRRML